MLVLKRASKLGEHILAIKVPGMKHSGGQILATTMHPLTIPLLDHHLKTNPNTLYAPSPLPRYT